MKIKRERKGLVFIALIMIILCVLITVIGLSLKQNTVEENLKQDPVIKALFVLEDDDKALFTNVLIYYPVTGKGVMVSIPGNTGGLHKSLNKVDRIDEIYSQLGIGVYLKEISSFVGIDIPFYVRINLDKYVELIDILGGIEVFIPSPIDTVSPTGEKWLLPSGRVVLDGEKIKTFISYSLEDENIDEILERKRDAFVSFLASVKSSANAFLNEKNFIEFYSRISFNSKEEDLLKLFQYISQVDTERFEYITVTGYDRNVDGKVLLMPFRNGEYIKDVVKKGINSIISASGTANARPYVMRILNGTSIKGLAHNTKILLQGAAFEVLDIGNVEGDKEVEHTYIIDHIGQRDAAKGIGEFIHCSKIVEEEIKNDDNENVSNVDFTLVLGKDFDGRWVSSVR